MTSRYKLFNINYKKYINYNCYNVQLFNTMGGMCNVILGSKIKCYLFQEHAMSFDEIK